jgi:hypothetical protein
MRVDGGAALMRRLDRGAFRAAFRPASSAGVLIINMIV